MIKRIVLALDGSPESQYALPIAKELALATGSAITVVHVREMMLAPVVGGVPRRIDADEVEERVATDVADLVNAGVDAELQIVTSRGRPTTSTMSPSTTTPG
jgi:nucleotide-binding universal stress UspA family protein